MATALSRTVMLDASVSVVQGRYREAGSLQDGTTFASGNRLPSIPGDKVRIDLVYRPSGQFIAPNVAMEQRDEFGLEFSSVGKIYANSQNSETTGRYSLVNARASRVMGFLGGKLTALARINNLTDRVYAASIIGDRVNGLYYEPGAPRNFLVGITYSAKF